MKSRRKIVTLCGSTRFKEEYLVVQKELTLQNEIVISVGVFGHSGDTITTDQKDSLDGMHLEKISMADYIYVINVGGYIGDSTKKEIDYAQSLGKPVIYHELKGED